MTEKTLRDEFAKMMAERLLSDWGSVSLPEVMDNIAHISYQFADNMLKAREQKEGGE